MLGSGGLFGLDKVKLAITAGRENIFLKVYPPHPIPPVVLVLPLHVSPFTTVNGVLEVF